MWILRDIIVRTGVDVGEITSPATGNQNFAPDFFAVVDEANAAPALPGTDSAHHSSPSRAKHYDVKIHP
jgi:hypothetical protein